MNQNDQMRIDANDLEKMGKERPNAFFLKGSGVVKLTNAIRQLEAENRELKQALAAQADAKAGNVDLIDALQNIEKVAWATHNVAYKEGRYKWGLKTVAEMAGQALAAQAAPTEVAISKMETTNERAPLVRLTEEETIDAYRNSDLDVCSSIRELCSFANAIMDAMEAKAQPAPDVWELINTLAKAEIILRECRAYPAADLCKEVLAKHGEQP